jgi:hypothetical protein
MGRGRASNVAEKATTCLGVGEGQMYPRSRVTPVEGRTLTLDELLKKEEDG